MENNQITFALVRDLFDYHESGHLIWKINKGKRIKAGEKAGGYNIGTGYYSVMVNSKTLLVHRVIFLWHKGYLPKLVDHKDRKPTNNKIVNLREATKSSNRQNSRSNSNNISGVRGVCWRNDFRIWIAQIVVNGRNIHLGYFDEFDKAVMARYNKEREIEWDECIKISEAHHYLKQKGMINEKNNNP